MVKLRMLYYCFANMINHHYYLFNNIPIYGGLNPHIWSYVINFHAANPQQLSICHISLANHPNNNCFLHFTIARYFLVLPWNGGIPKTIAFRVSIPKVLKFWMIWGYPHDIILPQNIPNILSQWLEMVLMMMMIIMMMIIIMMIIVADDSPLKFMIW